MTRLSEPHVVAPTRSDAPRMMLAAVCACAKAHGIATITIGYDGSGDEGAIDAVTLCGPADDGNDSAPEMCMPDVRLSTWTIPFRGDAFEIETTLESAIDDLGYELIAQNHAGWENGEGAYGELIIHVAAGKAKLEHSTRFVDTNCSSYEWEC